MKRLYASPLRVYLCLAALALAGILSGVKLPVSLFPNSSKPVIWSGMSYGSSTADEFLSTYGRFLESNLRAISGDNLEVEKVFASYGPRSVDYEVEFKWGTSPQAALKEVNQVVTAFASRFPTEVRDSVEVWPKNDNSGFLLVSFYSAKRTLEEVHRIIDQTIMPHVSSLGGTEQLELWNPTEKEIRVELDPAKMADLQLLPRDIDRALQTALVGYSGGAVTVGTSRINIEMPRGPNAVEDLNHVLVSTSAGRLIHLSDVAHVDLRQKTTNTNSFKTSGTPSILLWATPRAGGNVKSMAEDIIHVVERTMPEVPKDIQYKVVVDPSEFIRSAISNVFREVGIGALLAVLVLFLFIGSFRNTITAAIEIPLSMVLAFILMRFSGMNLNLISLGGLALAAGMNVDASVVVMENIFRHFEEEPGPHSFEEKLRIIVKAVSEVRFAVIASTLASLVVFVPLAFTSALSYAILGDLAKTVVFSHGFSAIVALVLVPTVRLHLMGKEKALVPITHSPIEPQIRGLENAYARALGAFIRRPKLQLASYAGLVAVLVALLFLVLPRLPKEIIGTPDTDWMSFRLNTNGNTLVRQMEVLSEEVEARLLKEYGSEIRYTFNRIWDVNSGRVMARLKDKRKMRELWSRMEKSFPNTPFLRIQVSPWNPSELPIPDPPQLKIAVRGGTVDERATTARELEMMLEEKKVFPRLWAEPAVDRNESIRLYPHLDQWQGLAAQGSNLLPSDLADIARVTTAGRRSAQMLVDNRNVDIILGYPDKTVGTAEDLASLPLGVGSKLVPLKALADVRVENSPPTNYREDGREVFLVYGRQLNQADGAMAESAARGQAEAHKDVAEWLKGRSMGETSVSFEDAEKDLHEALNQLGVALALSIALIFITLVLQFGSVANALLVLVAVPLGFIGVLVSLFVFGSTLSLNSVLGVILLNGIAVANSIILVDFLKRLVDRGLSPVEAAIEAGRKRLRPILITSATTILGMLPVALGLGDGGKILQPLGIAVSGGLWVSMGLTLFVVPALQVAYLGRRQNEAIVPKQESGQELGFRLGLRFWARKKGLPALSAAGMANEAGEE